MRATKAMDYQNRVAIVTGASSGIGREVALGLARRGVRLLLIARRESELVESARLCRAEAADAEILVGDVGLPDTAVRAIARVRERFGRLDVLVNNAGISKRKHVLAVTPEDAEETIRTNLLGPIRLVLEALPLMIARREGFIVNVSSVAGRMGNPREAVYSASKFGLAGFSEVLHYDLHRRGIRTILINPGPIATEIWQKLESPAAYRGRKHAPHVVAEAIFTAIERGEFERTVPRRFGAVTVLKALFPRWVRAGIDRFDPDDPSADPARADLDPRRTVRYRPGVSRATDLKIVRVLTADASAAAATFQANFALPETRSSSDGVGTTKALRIGAAEIEMTSPAGADSPFAKVLSERGAGLHELVLEVDDLDRARADLAARSIELVITTGADGRRRGAIAPAHTHGVHIQLIAR